MTRKAEGLAVMSDGNMGVKEAGFAFVRYALFISLSCSNKRIG